MAGSPGLTAARPVPAVAMTLAGTYAHRCGRVVLRVVRNASMAHPAANAIREAPMTRASDASGTTPKTRAAAPTTPMAMDANVMRPIGPTRVAGELVATSVGVVRAVVVMTVPFPGRPGWSATGTTVAVNGFARPGHMAGIAAPWVVRHRRYGRPVSGLCPAAVAPDTLGCGARAAGAAGCKRRVRVQNPVT